MNFLSYRTVVAVVVVLSMSSTGSASLMETLQECTNNSLAVGIAQCFEYKVETILQVVDFIKSTIDPDICEEPTLLNHYTGRRLQEDHSSKISGDPGMVLPLLNDRMDGKHKRIIEHFAQAAKGAFEAEKQVLIVENLKNWNLQYAIFDYFTEMFTTSAGSEENLSFLVSLSQFPDSFVDDAADLLSDETLNLPEIISCLQQFTQEDFEDGLAWAQCFFVCQDLITAGTCIQELFSDCGKWSIVGDIIIRGFSEFARLSSTCLLKVTTEDTDIIGNQSKIELTEGGPPAYVQVQTYMPPAAYCVDWSMLSDALGFIRTLRAFLDIVMERPTSCNVTVVLSLQSFWDNLIPHVKWVPPGPLSFEIGKPKCHSGKALRQAVIGEHEFQLNSSCVINITSESWNQNHSIPIWPAVDMKNDGDVTTNFTLRLKIKNRIAHSVKIETTIVDVDHSPKDVAVQLCQSSGDPHITTFDGHYYNNLYDGIFYLYKHTEQPFQIQVIYQRCEPNSNTSCTCGVAVQSGDDVFVIDRCRRIEQSATSVLKRTLLFTNGELTEGTRIFRQKDGAQFLVTLPTGLKVIITDIRNSLSVAIRPSSYDIDSTRGLCGVFNGQIDDDLTMPDDSIYDGPGSEVRGQPRSFSEAWRVEDDDYIFLGVKAASNSPMYGNFCTCNHVVLLGVQCNCGYGENLETCDDSIEDEITANISAILRRSLNETGNAEFPNIDIDLAYEPPELSWDTNTVWNISAAENLCLLDNNNLFTSILLRKCEEDFGTRLNTFLQDAEYHCLDDIQITDTDDWKWSALQYAQTKCMTSYRQRDVDLRQCFFDLVENSTCLNDCSGRGLCKNGICDCKEGWMGGDCNVPNSDWEIEMNNIICDKRYEDCHFATVFGRNFPPSGVECGAKETQISYGAAKISDKETKVSSFYISPNQLACELPSAGSYEIRLIDAATFSDPYIFITYDSACYTCNTDDATCDRKEPIDEMYDHCLIQGNCFAPGEKNPQQSCQFCSNNASSEWTWYLDSECQAIKKEIEDEEAKEKLEKNIRISLACILPAFIIACTIILYCNSRKNITADLETADNFEISPSKGDIYLQDIYLNTKSDKTDKTARNGYLPSEATTPTSSHKSPSTGIPNEAFIATDEQAIPVPNHVTVIVESDNGSSGNSDDGSSHLPPKEGTLHPPQLMRVIGEETGHGSRTSSFSSTISGKDFLRLKKEAKEKRHLRSRAISDSHSISSNRSMGIGGGGPLAFSQYNLKHYERHEPEFGGDDDDELDRVETASYHGGSVGIGAHGSITPTRKISTPINTFLG